MTRREKMDAIEAVRGDISDATRYLPTHPDAAKECLTRAMRAVAGVCPVPIGERLMINLAIALCAYLQDPDVFRGYAWGVRHELSMIRSRIEKQEPE